tara:strand:+ start:1362 stop:2153 length:792 start_codon:yes stop_codon:yes gene_type:complete
MTDKEGGFVRVYRRVLEDPDFTSAAEAMAFVYLILKASWRDVEVRYKGRKIALKRGQLALSLRDMAADLEWSKSRCERYLNTMKRAGKLGTGGGTPPGHQSGQRAGHLPGQAANVLTICKYDDYQLSPNAVETPGGTGCGTAENSERDSSGTQNNKGNEERRDITKVSSPTPVRAKPTPDMHPHVKELYEIIQPVAPIKEPQIVTAWERDGIDFPYVAKAVVRELVEREAKKTSVPIGTFRYFDAAVREEWAKECSYGRRANG